MKVFDKVLVWLPAFLNLLAIKMDVTTVTSTITISATAAEERLLYATRLATWLGTPADLGDNPFVLVVGRSVGRDVEDNFIPN